MDPKLWASSLPSQLSRASGGAGQEIHDGDESGFRTIRDGHLRAYSAEEGRVLWDFDTAREYQTVNGVPGNGGSLNGPGAVVVGGMVFVNSGYGRAGIVGNVLLAFAPEE